MPKEENGVRRQQRDTKDTEGEVEQTPCPIWKH